MKILPPRLIFTVSLVGGLAALPLVGCEKHPVEVAHAATADEMFTLTADWPAFKQSRTAKVDLLVMVDDSRSMAPLQTKLADQLAALTHVFAQLPGGLPDMHVGVVSSSMGAGRNSNVERCPPGGDAGRLHNALVGTTCAGVSLTDHYLAAHQGADGSLVTNWGTAPLDDAFGCIAQLGARGCDFSQPLSSVRHALDPELAPPENAGFVRDDALLAVVLLTNADDCSARADTDLFDESPEPMSDPLGPLAPFRCNEYGHLCMIDGALRPPPRAATGQLAGCRSNENGRLDRVSDFVAFINDLKKDPTRVFFGAVAGPPVPYIVGASSSAGLPATAQIEHSCMAASNGVFGDPAVRIKEAADAFGVRGVFQTICIDDFKSVLQVIASNVAQPLMPACVDAPAANGPGCTVIDRWTNDSHEREAARLPSCADSGGKTPCWSLVDDDTICRPETKHLVIDRTGAVAPSTLVTAIDCTTAHP
jgi:hypothetical protein